MVTHVFTHFPLELVVYTAQVPTGTRAPEGMRWVRIAILADEALPNVMRKVIACHGVGGLRRPRAIATLFPQNAAVPCGRRPDGNPKNIPPRRVMHPRPIRIQPNAARSGPTGWFRCGWTRRRLRLSHSGTGCGLGLGIGVRLVDIDAVIGDLDIADEGDARTARRRGALRQHVSRET